MSLNKCIPGVNGIETVLPRTNSLVFCLAWGRLSRDAEFVACNHQFCKLTKYQARLRHCPGSESARLDDAIQHAEMSSRLLAGVNQMCKGCMCIPTSVSDAKTSLKPTGSFVFCGSESTGSTAA